MPRSRVAIAYLLLAFAAVLHFAQEWASGQEPPLTAERKAEIAQFEEKIAPILAGRCLECHSATAKKSGLDLTRRETALAGGENGKVLVPGKPDESMLWEWIETDEMPPKKPLPKAEKELLKAWIAAGAPWGAGPIDALRYTSASRAGYDWWALKPIARPALPVVADQAWSKNPVDRFILAKLESRQLHPSQAAEKVTLLRRLSFDVTGLPPTPDELTAFLADSTPGAYEKLVDRLLASPHYGERWARHWLDIVRFGESQGFERDRIRPNSWRYRDWVIAAFNSDLPYDEFVRLQLAGDVLLPADPGGILATGFLVAAPWDEVGQSQQSAVMRAVVRQDELEDIVGTVGQTFLGMTVNCARCHDHKFDPISQLDYYRLTASLGGVRHGDRDSLAGEASPPLAERRKVLSARLGELNRELTGLEEPVRKRILAARKKKEPEGTQVPPGRRDLLPIARWEFDGDAKDQIGTLHGTLHGQARVEQGRLVLDGKDSYVSTPPLSKPLSAKTLAAWVLLPDLRQRSGGVMSVETLDGVVFDAIVYGERQERLWIAGSNGFTRTKDLDGPAETDAASRPVQITIVYHPDKSIALYRDGRPYGTPYPSSGLITFERDMAHVVFGMRHSPPGGNKMLSGSIERAALYDRALSAEEAAALAGVVDETISIDELLAELSREERQRRGGLSMEISQLTLERGLLASGTSYAVVPKQPELHHLLDRGNPGQPREVVSPGAIAGVSGPAAQFKMPPDAREAERRETLARWITDAHNPLFARVIVNRLWHYHFGSGLVDTPNDFGFNGGRPTHPELLDWLAAELIEQRFSLKQLHRTLLLSATYQQSSRYEAAGAKVDGENRLLWRKSPSRLEAEVVRDAVLAVSGQLNPEMGGSGFRDFRTQINNSQFYEMIDPVGYQYNRRSIYRTWIRSGTSKFLDVFDCPDPSTTTPKRAVTTTPLQALSLLNNSFVLRMSDRFADRLRMEAGADVEPQIRRAYTLAFARPATAEEVGIAAGFVRVHGMPAFCRVLFNANEFLYVD